MEYIPSVWADVAVASSHHLAKATLPFYRKFYDKPKVDAYWKRHNFNPYSKRPYNQDHYTKMFMSPKRGRGGYMSSTPKKRTKTTKLLGVLRDDMSLSKSSVRRVKNSKSKAYQTVLSNRRVTDMICPKFHFTTPFCEAPPFNVIDMANHDKENVLTGNPAYPELGKRSFLGDQDFVQHVHMPVKMWFEGVRRAANSPKAISTAGQLIDASDSTGLVSEAVPQSLVLQTDDTFWNSNVNGVMEYYSCDYTLTSVSEHAFTVEFTEVRPNKILFDVPSAVVSSNVLTSTAAYVASLAVPNTLSNTTSIVDNDPYSDRDPLSCLKRDLIEQASRIQQYGHNNKVVGAFSNLTGSNFNESATPQILNNSGVSLSMARDNFKRDYVVLSKRVVVVNPGETIKYRLVIPGFKQSAKRFSRYDNKFKTINSQSVGVASGATTFSTTNVTTTDFQRYPVYDEHSRFLLIRSFANKLVSRGTQSDAETSFAAGAYNLVSKISCGFQYVPYTRSNTGSYATYDSAFSLDQSAQAVTQTMRADQMSFINPETANFEVSADVDL